MIALILEDAVADLESGRRFYESREQGVGDYFVESLLSDVESLVLYAGIQRWHFGLHRRLSKRLVQLRWSWRVRRSRRLKPVH